jgi:hypothetical protein
MFDASGFPAPGAAASAASAPVDSGAIATWVSALADADREVSDTERVDRIRALEELKAAASAAQARATADLDASQRQLHADAGLPTARLGQGVAAQVALARRESPVRGAQHLGLAMVLTTEMPHMLRAMERGLLSEWRATLLARKTACLTLEDRRVVDQTLAWDPDALEAMSDRLLVAEVKRLAYRLDPESVVRRNRRAEAERTVTCRPAPDTMTCLTGLLPVAQGVAVLAALTREADSRRAEGDVRNRGQIMADTLVERVTGQQKASAVPVEINSWSPIARCSPATRSPPTCPATASCRPTGPATSCRAPWHRPRCFHGGSSRHLRPVSWSAWTRAGAWPPAGSPGSSTRATSPAAHPGATRPSDTGTMSWRTSTAARRR